MKFETSFFLETGGPFLRVLEGEKGAVEDHLLRVQRELPGAVMRRLRGVKMKTSQALFDEVAASLQFPAYFGDNWNALDECLTDLEWLPGSVYGMLITDAPSLLVDEVADELDVFVNLLARICDGWTYGASVGSFERNRTPFHAILQCEKCDADAFRERIGRASSGLVATLTV